MQNGLQHLCHYGRSNTGLKHHLEEGAQFRPGIEDSQVFYLKLRNFKLLHILQLFSIKFQFGLAYGG